MFAYPIGFQMPAHAIGVLAMVVVPAMLMVSTVRFRSFKTFDLQSRRSYPVLILFALILAVLAAADANRHVPVDRADHGIVEAADGLDVAGGGRQGELVDARVPRCCGPCRLRARTIDQGRGDARRLQADGEREPAEARADDDGRSGNGA